MRNRGRVLNRDQLLDAAWGRGVALNDRVVDNQAQSNSMWRSRRSTKMTPLRRPWSCNSFKGVRVGKVKPPAMGAARKGYGVVEDAPGQYIRQR